MQNDEDENPGNTLTPDSQVFYFICDFFLPFVVIVNVEFFQLCVVFLKKKYLKTLAIFNATDDRLGMRFSED